MTTRWPNARETINVWKSVSVKHREKFDQLLEMRGKGP